MDIGLVWGYWPAQPPKDFVEITQEAEKVGFNSVWTAESWGSDAFTPLTWLAANTSKIKLGTGVVQLSARTPVATAMAAMTLDHLSNGRVILGLGVSGPQVVEGWYGRPSNKPLARTREYVEIIRKALRREGPLENDGEFYPMPYRGEGSVGLGKPLKIMTHPLRSEIPIYLGAEGPKNVTQTAEIADGWLPMGFMPGAMDEYRPWLEEGFRRAGNGKSMKDFSIVASVHVQVDSDVKAALAKLKPEVALYVGGMGHKNKNFHNDIMVRRGFGDAAQRIQELYLAKRKDEAIAAVPDEWVDMKSLVGPPARIRERYRAWEDCGADTISVRSRAPAPAASLPASG